MGRRKQDWTKAKFERYVKEGRGQGSGKSYKPWITIQDFPSKGRVSRTPGWKSDRVHHFMSDWELRYFYLLEWSDAVIDIQEQYPLLDLDLAFCIADEIGIKYPKDKNTDVSYVLTTDFVLTIQEQGKSRKIARTVKMAEELKKKRTLEKLELEKVYWERQNVDWAIVTEQEISRVFADNVRWVHPNYHWELLAEQNSEHCRYINNILKDRLNSKQSRINSITLKLDRDMDLESGTCLSLFKHLIARKEIVIDMNEAKISSNSSTNIIQQVI